MEKMTPVLIPLVGVSGQERNHTKTQSKNAKTKIRLIPIDGSSRPVMSSSWSMRKSVKNEEQWDTSVYLVQNQLDSHIQSRENTLAFFTIKWPKVTPTKPHKRTLDYKLYKYKWVPNQRLFSITLSLFNPAPISWSNTEKNRGNLITSSLRTLMIWPLIYNIQESQQVTK